MRLQLNLCCPLFASLSLSLSLSPPLAAGVVGEKAGAVYGVRSRVPHTSAHVRLAREPKRRHQRPKDRAGAPGG